MVGKKKHFTWARHLKTSFQRYYNLYIFLLGNNSVGITNVNFSQNCQQGSVLVGAISFGKLSYLGNGEGKNPRKNPSRHQISYIVPPNKVLILSALYFDAVHFLID